MKKAMLAVILLAGALSMSFWLKRSAPTGGRSDLQAERRDGKEAAERGEAEAANAAPPPMQPAAPAKSRVTAQEKEQGPPPSPAEAMKNPAMRAMLQKQQLQGLDRRVRQLINAETQEKLGLTAPEAAQVRELLKRKQQPAIELMMGLMSGELDEAELAARGAEANAQRAETIEEIRNLLGPEKFAYLDWHERSEEDRTRMREWRPQFADAGMALSQEQEAQLTLAMFDERQKFNFSIDYADPSSFDCTRFDEYFSEANMERFFGEMEQLNQKTLGRAQAMLSPEQYQEFQRLQQEQFERSKATVRMTQTLFPMRKRGAP